MILNNFRLALRHLTRQKLNTFLHIVGLTLGMSVCLLIGLFLRYELSFDTYHQYASRTFRINSVWIESGKKDLHYSTPMPLAEALRNEVTGPEIVVQAHPLWDEIVEINPQKILKQERLLVVDPTFIDVFSVESIKGNAREAMSKPYQALLTETTAKKFYGDEDPVGKTFTYKNEFQITVAGVIKDFPANTHVPASILLSYVGNEKFLGHELNAWSNVTGTMTYVVLPEGHKLNDLQLQLQGLADKNINSDPNMPKFLRSEFEIQPLGDIHFNASPSGGGHWVKAVNVSWLWFFAIIGLAVLALACINFVNLSTAQALTRAKEVGVRKSVGAGRVHLISQFLREAWILTFISGVLSVSIAQMSLPFINTLLAKGITFDILESPGLIGALVAGIFLTGLLAGLYPAWIIAKFNPVKTLKTGGSVAGDQSSYWLRRSLVVLQFTISAGLLIALILISQQVNYMRNKSLGFDKDNVINVGIPTGKKDLLLAGQLAFIPQIKDFTFATSTPSHDHWGTSMSLTDMNDPSRKHTTMILADERFCRMYGFKLVQGRLLEPSDTSYVSRTIPDEKQVSKIVVNERFIRELGFKSNEEAIGKRIWFGMGNGKADIVGVVADFNANSLHGEITPMLITSFPGLYSQTGIKVEAGSNIPETIASIEKAWKKVYPDGVFEFKFLDEQIDAFYKAEARLYHLFKIFAGLAMLISCLGLWGLSTLSAQQRTKEIGIRKVLGASVNAIVMMLSRDFFVMVIIALAIASPLAYYLVNNWLQSFAFHIDIQWQVFIIAGLASVIIALVSVSFHSIKAGLANPVDSLRNE